METLLRRLLWCFGTRHRHRKGKPRRHCHDHDILARLSAPCGTAIRAVEPRPAKDAGIIQASRAGNQEFFRDRAAAATIQAHFRGHLARQAFRALRSLVKLQAFARGAYVRKQASIAIRCMNVLVRLQVRARSRQLRHAQRNRSWQKRRDT